MNYFTKALKTLGLKSLTSKKELKKAYHKKSKECHPDNGGDGVKFIELNKCYQYLCNKFAEKYIIKFSVDDLLRDKIFMIKDLVKISLTHKNLKSRYVKFDLDGKKFSVKFKYKDEDKFPITVENENVYINVYQDVGLQEFINNKAIIDIGNEMRLVSHIPNSGKLEVTRKFRSHLYIRVFFKIYRPKECDYRITTEDLKEKCYVK